jgi:hypothetical protein
MPETGLTPALGEISYNDTPEKKIGPELWVHRMKANEEFTCTVYGSAVKGVETHWVAGGTQPHYRDSKICPGCQAQVRIDWKGYLHVFVWQKKAQIFLELTRSSYEALMSQVVEGKPLRGSVIKVKRTKAANGRLMIAIDGHTRRPEKDLPPEKDPRRSILRMWKIADGPSPLQEEVLEVQADFEEVMEPPPDHL